jgi:parallel beta-helix repeat protein
LKRQKRNPKNADEGLDIDNGDFDQSVISDVDIINIKANGNGENCNCDGIEIDNLTDVTISGVTTDNNAQDGIDIEDSSTVLIQNSSARGNAQNGLEIDVLVAFQGSNITSTGNAVGLLFEPKAALADPLEYLGDITLTRSIVRNNGDGILFARAGPSSNISISGSDLAGNTTWGAGILGPQEDEVTTYEVSSAEAVVVALDNYWGAASGPTHPTNPNGAGDVVADGRSNVERYTGSGTGTINFGDYRTKSITASVPVPALGGLALLLLTILTAGIARRQFRRI